MLFAVLALRPAPAPAQSSDPQVRGKPFWQALAKGCEVPAGQTAFGLMSEALDLLGSPDPGWRDGIGYDVVARCVYERHALTREERRALILRLIANLRRGIGESAGDSVLLRSFSALDLSIFAALEDEDPALDAAGFRQLLDAALSYLSDEHDLRGLDPRVGWIHATAHTADLLKFLARDRRFTPADQGRLLDAVFRKLVAPGTPVFTRGEDERLAATVLAVVRRGDFDPGALDPWLARFVALEGEVWRQSPPAGSALDAAQNARNLLRSLYVLLSLPTPAGAPARTAGAAELAARERVLATLADLRR